MNCDVFERSRAPFCVDFSVNVWKRRAAGLLIFLGFVGRERGKCAACHEVCPLGGGKRRISHFDRSAGERKVWHAFVSAWGLEVPLYRLFFCALLVLMKSGRVCAKTGGLFGESCALFSATARVFER